MSCVAVRYANDQVPRPSGASLTSKTQQYVPSMSETNCKLETIGLKSFLLMKGFSASAAMKIG